MSKSGRVYASSLFGHPTSRKQCNCACAISDDVRALDTDKLKGMLCQSSVYQCELSQTHKLLFSQLHGKDVVVVNNDAYDLWQKFEEPIHLKNLLDSDRGLAHEMIRLGLLEPISKQEYTCKPVPDELNVWLHVTNSCNLTCSYCYVKKTNEHMSLETGKAAIHAAFRSALAEGFSKVTFKYAGGEPTLQLETVFQLHKYAQEVAAQHCTEMEAVILSNGVSLDLDSLVKIKDVGMQLMISLDGLGDIHDTQRPFLGGQGSFNKVWKTLEQALEIGLDPFISITVTDESAAGLPDLVDQLLPLGVPFNLNFARPVMPGKLPDNHKMIAGLMEAFKRIEANLPEYSLMGSLLDRAFFSAPHLRPCSVGETYMIVDHDGKVAGCQMTIDQAVTDIEMDNPLLALKMFESRKNPSVEEKEGCRQCEWKYMCAGGCPLTAYHATGRYDVASPFCEVYKTIYPELLRLEGLRILKLSATEIPS